MEKLQVPAPDSAEYRFAEPTADSSAEPPREMKGFGPHEAGPVFAGCGEGESSLAGYQPHMAYPDGFFVGPFGYLHAVGQPDRADLCQAIEGGAETPALVGGEDDGLRIVHPLNMRGDVADVLPHLFNPRREFRLHPDVRHAPRVEETEVDVKGRGGRLGPGFGRRNGQP